MAHPHMPFLSGFTIIFPLNTPIGYGADFIEQTAANVKKRNRIIFLEVWNPVSLYRFLFHKYDRSKVIAGILSLIRNGNVTHFVPLGILPFQRVGWVRSINRQGSILQLRLLLKICSCFPIGIWGFHPWMGYYVGKLGETFSVYDCVDDYTDQHVSGYSIQKLERHIFQHATIVAFNSERLFKRKTRQVTHPVFRALLLKKACVVPCGCDTALFRIGVALPDRIAGIKRPQIGFIGYMDYRMDLPLVFSLISHHPQWNFIFIGPVSAENTKKKLQAFSNVRVLGERKKSDLPALIGAFDVGIIPYNTRILFVRSCNPMKAYEYLACGKPVVATDIPSLRDLTTPYVQTTRNAAEFSSAITNVLRHWKETDANKARSIAELNNWEQKIKKIEHTLEGLF